MTQRRCGLVGLAIQVGVAAILLCTAMTSKSLAGVVHTEDDPETPTYECDKVPLPAEYLKKEGLREVGPNHYARQLLDRILTAAKYHGARIRLCCAKGEDVNAYATFITFNKTVLTPEGPKPLQIPIIAYNAHFMTQYEFSTGNEYVPLYIFAHELGHIILRHPDATNPLSRTQHPWQQELEADEFAGAVLARLGAKAEDLQITQRMFCIEKWFHMKKEGDRVYAVFGQGDKQVRVSALVQGSKTHPDAVQRIQAIARGWRRGGGEGDVEANLTAIFHQLAAEFVRWDPDIDGQQHAPELETDTPMPR